MHTHRETVLSFVQHMKHGSPRSYNMLKTQSALRGEFRGKGSARDQPLGPNSEHFTFYTQRNVAEREAGLRATLPPVQADSSALLFALLWLQGERAPL